MTDNQHNPPLAIPAEAYTAAHFHPQGELAGRARTFARLLVAAELRRLASDLYRRSDNVPLHRDGGGIERVGALRDLADQLSARADQLDGGTR